MSTSSKVDIQKEVTSHAVAIAELSNLPSSRKVYQINGNLFFRTSIQKATKAEQKQLDSANARLQKLTSS